MNFSNILSRLTEVDPETYEQSSVRRSVIKTWMRGAALAALPLTIGSMTNKAYGKVSSNDPILDALNLLLKLKYLEYAFYKKALQASVGAPASADPLIPSGFQQSAIIEIHGQELKHSLVLHDNISRYSPGNAIDSPNFDFTAAGAYPTVFDDYDVFLSVAQIFEDTGVRAFKGILPLLVGKNDLLSTILRVHTAEARHAAHIRVMRRDTPSPLNSGVIKPWVTSNFSNINSGSGTSSYINEDNTLQANIQITNINGLQINDNAATESFDEPLDVTAVAAIIAPFIV